MDNLALQWNSQLHYRVELVVSPLSRAGEERGRKGIERYPGKWTTHDSTIHRQLNMRMDNGYGYGVSLKYRRSTVFSTFFRRFFSIWVYDLLKSVTGYSIRALD